MRAIETGGAMGGAIMRYAQNTLFSTTHYAPRPSTNLAVRCLATCAHSYDSNSLHAHRALPTLWFKNSYGSIKNEAGGGDNNHYTTIKPQNHGKQTEGTVMDAFAAGAKVCRGSRICSKARGQQSLAATSTTTTTKTTILPPPPPPPGERVSRQVRGRARDGEAQSLQVTNDRRFYCCRTASSVRPSTICATLIEATLQLTDNHHNHVSPNPRPPQLRNFHWDGVLRRWRGGRRQLTRHQNFGTTTHPVLPRPISGGSAALLWHLGHVHGR